MTPVRAIKNQYVGVNAHLHSYWQAESGWESFHTNHIADLMRLMSAQLLPMGYIAEIEQSLQIRHLDETIGKPESDVTIYDTRQSRLYQQPARLKNVPAVAMVDVMHLESELSPYRAVGVYKAIEGKRAPGKPVARIELLSPSNKPGGQDAAYYREKRRMLLHSGLVFVEIDYLHESSTTFEHIPGYHAPFAAETHPYHIFVIDPRPVFREGVVYPYHFDVDKPIPVVPIPLSADDTLEFDFGKAYQKTYEETLYGARYVDYSQLPLHFDRYSRDDQMRILVRMTAILTALKDGVDLETNAPLPTTSIEFEAAFKRFVEGR